MVKRRYFRGEKSTSLRTSDLVYRDGRWWASWVWNEEADRRKAPRQQAAYREFTRLMTASRSS